MRKPTLRFGLAALACFLGTVTFHVNTVQAATSTITSADFSFAYGSTEKVVAGSTWTLNENPGSVTTIGDFTFSPAPTGQVQSGTGPTFFGATLADGGGDDINRVGSLSDPFGSATGGFLLPISASYNGSAPIDAAPIPNYRLMLEITNLSIYAARAGNGGPTTLAWDEVTPSHAQTSTSINLNLASTVTLLNSASTYTQLVWDPSDYDTALGSLNSSFTRTFDFLPGTGNDLRIGDGIQISGRVHLIYDTPEPGSYVLMVTGLTIGSVLMYRRRKHDNAKI